jgi:hypothetical protein
VDNLWLTPEGGIVLGECKLARNPQARREVVAQVLDYAAALRSMHYDDLEGAVRQALRDPGATLWSFVSKQAGLEEAQFADAVERRLRLGQFLLLIIGDGIQAGAEALVSSLQLHAGIHAALALVELSIWRIGRLKVIVPRIPLRTTLVERGIVVVDGMFGARIDPPAASGPVSLPRTLSEEEFYAKLDVARLGISAQLRTFTDSLAEIGITPEFKKTLVLRWRPSEDLEASAGYIESNGKVWMADGFFSAKKLGFPEVGDRYVETIARALGGRVNRSGKDHLTVLGADGHAPDVPSLLAVGDVWKEAISRLVADTYPK